MWVCACGCVRVGVCACVCAHVYACVCGAYECMRALCVQFMDRTYMSEFANLNAA